MRIWVDLANSPQVLFFEPILKELLRRKHDVEITTREYAQTVELAQRHQMPNTVIGRHGGRGLGALAYQNYSRTLRLASWSLRRRFDLALSHNSYSQAMASALVRIPFVTIMDYEHQPLNHICFRLARKVIVPQAFPLEMLSKYGAQRKTSFFAGIKEQVYLSGFVPEPDFRAREGLPTDQPLVVVRPPAPWTAYHRFNNDVFDQLLSFLSSHWEGCLLFLPRLASQAESVSKLPRIQVATRVYDGPNLLHAADLVISGGGTMNREAAVLGTPTATVFKGRPSEVDRYLIERGRMLQITERQDFDALLDLAKTARQPTLDGQALVTQITDEVLSAVQGDAPDAPAR